MIPSGSQPGFKIPSGSQPGSRRERRRFTRVPARQLRGSLFARGVGNEEVWVVDISLGGALLRTTAPLPVSEPLSLELPRQNSRSMLRLQGRVASNRGIEGAQHRPGIGIRFDAIDPMMLLELRELIRSFAPSNVPLETPETNETTVATGMPRIPKAVMPILTAAEPVMIAPMVAPVKSPADDAAHLKIHVKGLLFQIGEMQSQLDAKNRELDVLREAIRRLQTANAQLERTRL